MAESKLSVLLSAAQIHTRIQELGAQIDKDYEGSGPLYMLCVLKGAVLFFSDLARAIQHPTRMDFIGLSSYGKGKSSSGEIRITKDLDTTIEGYDVLIVEDILDSGITLSYLVQILKQRKPRSVRIATLLDKPERRVRPVVVDYVGFKIPDAFVVGYGLDFGEDYRQLKDVCMLSE
ncbi:MAG TPA: hypoxanthine phosphoribosyltransferase [Bryobacteraceae bacterium]|nr:hypoxanthine phosphoribosyltransferase [Bryobacteraceae bacterium]